VEYKLFDQVPEYCTEKWHESREVADHLHQPGHRERLLHALDVLDGILASGFYETVSDFGCGNGGLLSELKIRHPMIAAWGYDFSPKAIEYARAVYQVDARFWDITKNGAQVGGVVVVTETLEHLLDPHGWLRELFMTTCKAVLASSPAFETPEAHYPFHLWAWTEDSYAKMFRDAGFEAQAHINDQAQYVVARRPIG
jgi:trans-aconitate methyltransferase